MSVCNMIRVGVFPITLLHLDVVLIWPYWAGLSKAEFEVHALIRISLCTGIYTGVGIMCFVALPFESPVNPNPSLTKVYKTVKRSRILFLCFGILLASDTSFKHGELLSRCQFSQTSCPHCPSRKHTPTLRQEC